MGVGGTKGVDYLTLGEGGGRGGLSLCCSALPHCSAPTCGVFFPWAFVFPGGTDGGREGPLRRGSAAGPLGRALEGAAGAVQWDCRAQGRGSCALRNEGRDSRREESGERGMGVAPTQTRFVSETKAHAGNTLRDPQQHPPPYTHRTHIQLRPEPTAEPSEGLGV